MKYIKKYNESNSEVLDEQEIKDFCEMNLAYLMDEGLKVIVDDFGYGVILSLKDVDEKNRKWIDIKDQIIPFLIRLKDQYELKTFSWVTDLPTADIVFVTSMKYGTEDEGYSDYFTTDGVINDRITRDWAKFTSIYKVNEISFYIKNKKLT
jgi:hypothetical protein